MNVFKNTKIEEDKVSGSDTPVEVNWALFINLKDSVGKNIEDKEVTGINPINFTVFRIRIDIFL